MLQKSEQNLNNNNRDYLCEKGMDLLIMYRPTIISTALSYCDTGTQQKILHCSQLSTSNQCKGEHCILSYCKIITKSACNYKLQCHSLSGGNDILGFSYNNTRKCSFSGLVRECQKRATQLATREGEKKSRRDRAVDC